jgi:hypothetical protein
MTFSISFVAANKTLTFQGALLGYGWLQLREPKEAG